MGFQPSSKFNDAMVIRNGLSVSYDYDDANCTTFFWLSVVTALRAKFVNNTIFHWSYSHERLHKKWKFPLRISSVNMTKSLETSDLVTLTEEIFIGKLHFLCRERYYGNFCQKGHVYYENLKQTIWSEIFPVSELRGPKDFQIFV